MLIALLIRLIAEVFVTRPAGIAPGRWSPHAKLAVRHLEQRHFALPIALGLRAVRRPRRDWTVALRSVAPEGEWSCR